MVSIYYYLRLFVEVYMDQHNLDMTNIAVQLDLRLL